MNLATAPLTKALPQSIADWAKTYKPDPLTQKWTTLGAGGWIKGPLTCLKEAGYHLDDTFIAAFAESTKADLAKRGWLAGGANSLWMDPLTSPIVANAGGYQQWDWQHYTLAACADLFENGVFWARDYVLQTYASYLLKKNVPFLRTGGTAPLWMGDGGRPRTAGRIVQADYDVLRTLRIGGAPKEYVDFVIENASQRTEQIIEAWPLTAKPAGDHLRETLDYEVDGNGHQIPTGKPIEHVEVFMLAHLAEACALLYAELPKQPSAPPALLGRLADIIQRVRKLLLLAILNPMDIAYDLAVAPDKTVYLHDATLNALALPQGDFRKKWIAHGIGGVNAWLYRTLKTMGNPAAPCVAALREDAKKAWGKLPMLQIQYVGEIP